MWYTTLVVSGNPINLPPSVCLCSDESTKPGAEHSAVVTVPVSWHTASMNPPAPEPTARNYLSMSIELFWRIITPIYPVLRRIVMITVRGSLYFSNNVEVMITVLLFVTLPQLDYILSNNHCGITHQDQDIQDWDSMCCCVSYFEHQTRFTKINGISILCKRYYTEERGVISLSVRDESDT